MTKSFYLIWRNIYIRRLIRNHVCQDLVFDVLVDGWQKLDDIDYKYLSLFTDKEKLDYNISIRLKGRDVVEQYVDNQFYDLINDVDIKYYVEDILDFSVFHRSVQKLSLTIAHRSSTAINQLPSSLTYLYVDCPRHSPQVLKHILSSLPTNLKTLRLQETLDENMITSECRLPDSLTNLDFSSVYNNFKWFVVPPNKVFKHSILVVDSMDAITWLKSNKWIQTIFVVSTGKYIEVSSANPIPEHAINVTINSNVDLIEKGIVFSPQLELLKCDYGIPFSHYTHLRALILNGYPEKLEMHVLPITTQLLQISSYNQPLEANVLPPNLTKLTLDNFNQPLSQGILPNSLTELSLREFDHPLMPFVLPPNLTELNIANFKQQATISPNTLPSSLTYLDMGSFTGSFEPLCQPLDHLTDLLISSLDPTVSTILRNVKDLDLSIETIPNARYGTCLFNTGIETLYLQIPNTCSLYPKSFPPTIKNLTLDNFKIQSKGVIPSTCKYLKSLSMLIYPDFIPKSTIYKKIDDDSDSDDSDDDDSDDSGGDSDDFDEDSDYTDDDSL
ncbi:hypothetical protein CYY_009209 [Polysphondylium violaceum]|uniref:FNIP repeat-containing protein n=1 Tax=Polysphondylium violaceum TaxID=133409 RepID=A0A8J4PU07_9MYCE|nr:hypothetical protein CYY_009209 [Polysphondylium violaceum]